MGQEKHLQQGGSLKVDHSEHFVCLIFQFAIRVLKLFALPWSWAHTRT